MKKLLTIIFFLLAYFAQARNFYFSSLTGNDLRTSTESQSIATPWKTLTKLNSFFSSLLPGDSVLFKKGETFYGFITVNKSGNSSNPIVLGSYGSGEQPIITSLVPLSGWTETFTGSHIWKSSPNNSLGATVNIVLKDNTLQPLGRYPNLSATNKGYLKYESSTSTSITDNELPLSPSWVGGQLCIRPNQFSMETTTITAQANTKLSFAAPLQHGTGANMGYFIQNHILTLDQPGEWCYLSSTKQIAMYSIGAPTGTIQATSLDNLITSTTFSWVTITGLNLTGANDQAIDIGVCSSCGSGGTDIAIKNNSISFSQVAVSFFQHLRPTIKYNDIKYSTGQGIYVSNGDGADIGYNNIYWTGQLAGMGASYTRIGIFTRLRAHVYNNRIVKTGFDGIYYYGSGSYIENNVIDTFCNVLNDGGGVYTYTTSGYSVVRNNVIRNGIGATEGGINPSLLQAEGIYLDLDSRNVQITGNSISNCGDAGIFINQGSNNGLTRNNTIYNCKWQIWVNSKKGHRIRTDTIRNNIFFARLASQFTVKYQSDSADLQNFGLIDSNYYERPISEPQGINNAGTSATGGNIEAIRGTRGFYSLDRWKIYMPTYDQHSFISPKAYDTIRYEVNTSYRDSVVVLTDPTNGRAYTYITARGVRVKGTVTLPPFTSLVMIRDTIVPITSPINIKPTVSLTSPANNSSYTAPASIPLAATAGDADGTITKVDFYNGSTKLGTDNSSPYTLSLINVPAGGYSFTARTFDNSGDSTTSAAVTVTVSDPPPVNTPPVVSLTSPSNGATYNAPASILFTATASDNGSIAQVQFYNGATLLNTDFSAPYTYLWTSVGAGTYNLTAKATDNLGLTTTSGAVSVTVQTVPPVNVPPTVSLTAPANNAIYGEPATVYLLADATDQDGSITQVDFYNGATLLATDIDSPYVYTWLTVAAGNYNITAKATDNSGATATSSVASITVVANVPPTISITSPADNSNYTTPADITIDVSASDADGNVTVVNFYEGSTYLGSDSVAPYTFNVSGYTTGSYTFFATATDNSGDSTTSSGIDVTVNPPSPLAINIQVEPILCNGGTTTITTDATGGTPPYTGTGSTVVGPGTYTRIVIDDDGTQDTAIVTVANPGIISLTDSLGTISQYAGSTLAVVYASGGTGIFQWQINGGQWQNSGRFAVPAGNYVVNVKDSNNCTSSISFSITQPTSTGVLNMQIKRVGRHVNVNR